MGKHSSDRQWPFYRSLIAWVIPWVLLGTIVIGAAWATVRAIGGDELDSPPPRRSQATASAPAAEPTKTAEPSESPDAAGTPEGDGRARTNRKKNGAKKKDEEPELITSGISVQVLNATATTGAAARMGDRLRGLGFRVVSEDRASRAYERTTVFWSYPGARPAARRLARRFGWRSAPKPRNLSATAAIHVIVGLDEV